MKKVKKAQVSGTGAAVLIAVIGALIILYILFLPPETREELLEGKQAPGVGVSDVEPLLIASPGRLDYLAQNEIEHSLAPVNLFSTTHAQIIKTVSSLYIRRGWFDKTTANFTFAIGDMPNTDNVLLGFNVKQHKGRLIVKFNGQEVFNSEIKGLNVDPIRLSDELLREKNNVEFSVSGVGFRFWETNTYDIEGVKVTADVTDITTQEAKEMFLVTATEKDASERASLRFYPDCTAGKVGILNIYLNNHNIYSAIPDCGMMRLLEISPTVLTQGENTLLFRTSKGAYLVDSIVLKTELKELTYPTFYFELDEPMHAAIWNNEVSLKLYMDFPDDVEYKKAEVYVNGHLQGIDTYDRTFTMDLSPFVNIGNNVIEVKPKTTLDIPNLRVYLE